MKKKNMIFCSAGLRKDEEERLKNAVNKMGHSYLRIDKKEAQGLSLEELNRNNLNNVLWGDILVVPADMDVHRSKRKFWKALSEYIRYIPRREKPYFAVVAIAVARLVGTKVMTINEFYDFAVGEVLANDEEVK